MNNMLYPILRFVFNRRGTAARNCTASVELEIAYKRKQKRMSTGIRLYLGEWDASRQRVCNRDDMLELNDQLASMMSNVRQAVNTIMEGDEEFSFGLLDATLSRKVDETFLDWVEQRIRSRKDLALGTYRHHMSWLNVFKEYGKIVYFSDLTRTNIVDYDNWLHGRGIGRLTILSHHKTAKVYVHEALALDLIKKDPYAYMKYERIQGDEGNIRYLTEEEVMRIRSLQLDGCMDRIRDLFVVQCYTGMAYSDLMNFDFAKQVQKGENVLVRDNRIKTGQTYYLVLLKPVLEVLGKYNNVLPKISNQKYNNYLKVLQQYAQIETKVTSHVGRHTFATMMLNKGVSIEVVAKMLGHSTSKTTAIYAKVIGKSVEAAFRGVDLE